MRTSNSQAISDIKHIIDQLKAQPSLSPSPEINQLFNWLVSIIYEHANSHDDSNCILCLLLKELPELHRLCSTGEFEMECYWSKHFSTYSKSLAQFPYYQHYQKLVVEEEKLLAKYCSANQKRMLFVGSGPLPLSALLFAQNYKWQVDCLDKDQQAYWLGKRFIHSQNANKNIRCIHEDIYQYKQLRKYDIVVLGALVGSDHEQKQEIMKHLATHTNAETKLLVRSTKGLRTLLYPELKLEIIKFWKILEAKHPTDEVINSMVLLAKS